MLTKHHQISFVCVFLMIFAAISYLVLVMSTVHVYSANILHVELLKSVKFASFVPKLTNGKRPVHLGGLEGKLKNLVGVFPITAVSNLCT